MKVTKYFIILIFFIGCSSINHSKMFTFYDAYGKMYKSNTASVEIKKEFDLDSNPKLVVLATSSKSNPKYIKQLNDISKVNAEETEYLFIVANSEEEDQSGYYIKMADAANYLSGSTFQVVIYDEHGKIIKKSNDIIFANDLKIYLAK